MLFKSISPRKHRYLHNLKKHAKSPRHGQTPPLEKRLQRRYERLVKAHCNSVPELAAGMKALPDSKTSFAHTQALWRFLHNDSVTPSALAQPLLAGAQEAIQTCCQHYTLVAHDWSR